MHGQFIPRISEQPFRAGVSFDDTISVQIDDDDGVRPLFDKQTKEFLSLQAHVCMLRRQRWFDVSHLPPVPYMLVN